MRKSGIIGNLYTIQDLEAFETVWAEWKRKTGMLKDALNEAVGLYQDRRGGITTNLDAALKSFGVFDAGGKGYDTATALNSGMSKERMGQTLGRNVEPLSGLILIGKNNEYWDETVQWQQSLGNKVIKGNDDRYYAVQDTPQSDEYQHDIVSSGIGGGALKEGEPEEHTYMILKGGQWIADRLLTEREYAWLGKQGKWSWAGGAAFEALNIPDSFQVDSLTVEELSDVIKGDSNNASFSDSIYTSPSDSLGGDFFEKTTSYNNPEMPEELRSWKFVGYSKSLFDKGTPQFENMITGEISGSPILSEFLADSTFETNRGQFSSYQDELSGIFEDKEKYGDIILALNDIENQKTKLEGNYKGGSSTKYVRDRMAKLDEEKTELENSLSLLLQENPAAKAQISFYKE